MFDWKYLFLIYLFVLVQCLENPNKPQYNGGIIVNPDLQNGTQGWSQFGNANVDFREFGGNKFVVARERNQSYDSVSQKVYLEKGLLYTFSGKNNFNFLFLGAHSLEFNNHFASYYLMSFMLLVAWLQVSEGNAPVGAVFKMNSEYLYAGSVVAESKCWSMLKGGLTVDESGPAELYFEVSIHKHGLHCLQPIVLFFPHFEICYFNLYEHSYIQCKLYKLILSGNNILLIHKVINYTVKPI